MCRPCWRYYVYKRVEDTGTTAAAATTPRGRADTLVFSGTFGLRRQGYEVSNHSSYSDQNNFVSTSRSHECGWTMNIFMQAP